MKSLKEYLIETVEYKRKYVAIVYDQETQDKLRTYCDKNAFDISQDYDGNYQDPEDFKFHTTIFYTTSKHNIENKEVTLEFPKSVEPISFEMLGHNKDVPVIKVMSDDISELRKYYETEYEMKDEWSDWKPHISLSYSSKDFPENIELPDFSLIYDKIVIEDGAEEN